MNEKGVAFYNQLIDALLEAGIQPFITLFHWDYPYALFKKGAWMNEESPLWFAEYAKVAAERFSDRVTHLLPSMSLSASSDWLIWTESMLPE